jgi:hypothetical protein
MAGCAEIKNFATLPSRRKINALDGAEIRCGCPQQVESGWFGKAAQQPPPWAGT